MNPEIINKITETIALAEAEMRLQLTKLPHDLRADLEAKIKRAMETKDTSELLKFAKECRSK
jgi:hypothetical protein